MGNLGKKGLKNHLLIKRKVLKSGFLILKYFKYRGSPIGVPLHPLLLVSWTPTKAKKCALWLSLHVAMWHGKNADICLGFQH